ncbi:hypothetical protein RUMTOR_02527 [[Ruminococcus] torques ATCC 27756]|uniref:Uncharacterized protein n=1 Tax=[Ruminococcus] torques ATCC 27756 TaxID=411460 RepID=A5KQI9_9FIRM|nr:hypothetical protein RUMTOR_02527 [[Ruminococcus] torques ATCC 27756]
MSFFFFSFFLYKIAPSFHSHIFKINDKKRENHGYLLR